MLRGVTSTGLATSSARVGRSFESWSCPSTLWCQVTYASGPPTNEKDQCKAIRKNGKRCRKWHLRDSDFCQFHFGRTNKRAPIKNNTGKLLGMPHFYRRVLRSTLQETFDELVLKAPAEQVQLFEELALMRLTVLDCVKLYDIASSTNKPEIILDAGMTMRLALKEVADLCSKAASIEAAGKDKLSVHHITFVVNQIVRLAFETFSEHTELAEEFERRVRTDIKLPSVQGGTLLTPDQDVEGMDDSIPRRPVDV